MQGQLQETMFKIIEGDSQPFYLFIYLFILSWTKFSPWITNIFIKKICHIKFHEKFHNPVSLFWIKNNSCNFTKKSWSMIFFLKNFSVNRIYVIESHDKSLGLRGRLFIYLFFMDQIDIIEFHGIFLVCHSQPFFQSQIFFFQFFSLFRKWFDHISCPFIFRT